MDWFLYDNGFRQERVKLNKWYQFAQSVSYLLPSYFLILDVRDYTRYASIFSVFNSSVVMYLF